MNKERFTNGNISNYLVGFFVFFLFVIWSAPETIALRNGLFGLLALSVVSGTLIKKHNGTLFSGKTHVGRLQFILLAMLSGWMLLVMALWAPEKGHVLSEIRGQWAMSLLLYMLGYFSVFASKDEGLLGIKNILYPIFYASLTLVFLSIVLSAVFYYQTGEVPFVVGSSALAPQRVIGRWNLGFPLSQSIVGESPDKFSMIIFLLIVFLLSELISRALAGRRFFEINNWALLSLVLLAVAAQYLNRSRNGNLIFLESLLLSLIIILKLYPTRAGFIKIWLSAGFIIAASLMTLTFVKSDHRWQDLLETVPLALDANNKGWLYRDADTYPKLKNGDLVDVSNYERVAWAKEGVLLIMENPLGLGYNRHAFGDALDKKYEREGLSRGGHSHSGLVDFAIANGLPGLLLWMVFLLSIGLLGVRELARGNFWLGSFILIYVSGFMLRSLVDSVLRDHFLQQFMFIAGILVNLVRLSGARETVSTANQGSLAS